VYKIICFDLDGTLCNTNGIDYESATPKVDRINKVNELYDNGVKILIESARGSVSKTNWYHITKTQLEKWGVKYHELRTGVKMNADLYVDDKGINDNKYF
jgi:alcohol dehydrogenase YqhD (iron-dependent ADH family)